MEDTFKRLLARYHDGELTRETARTVERHLATCETCRAELLALRALSATLAGAPAPDPATDAAAFWQELQPKLRAQSVTPPLRSWLPGLLLLGLQGLLGISGALLTIGPLLRWFTGIDADLPGLPLPGLLSIGLFGWAGALYLIWLVAWWSRYHPEPNKTYV